MKWSNAGIATFALCCAVGVSAQIPAMAERQCNVPAGYYRLVDIEEDGAIEFRQNPTHRSKLISALAPGDIVQSDGTRSAGEPTWQQVRIMQTTGWVPARKLWRTLPLTLERSNFPASGWCGNATPPWSMSWEGEKLRLSLYPGRYETRVKTVTVSANDTDTLISGETAGLSYKVIYSEDVCRDPAGAMAGLGRVHLIVSRDGEDLIYSGCCAASTASFSPAPVRDAGQ